MGVCSVYIENGFGLFFLVTLNIDFFHVVLAKKTSVNGIKRLTCYV